MTAGPRIEQPFTAGSACSCAWTATLTCPDTDVARDPERAGVRPAAGPLPTLSRDAAKHTSTTIDWLELMGLNDPEASTCAAMECTAGPAASAVPIGVSERGDTVELDIKEAARNGMGPHGYGGRYRFWKVRVPAHVDPRHDCGHPPDVLNLVLVDFKGGATFLGLDRVRHVSAIITNLADEAHLVRGCRMRLPVR
jgi:S-DNA-T family DNA segregation ATPase FtsK/SpoIIIE